LAVEHTSWRFLARWLTSFLLLAAVFGIVAVVILPKVADLGRALEVVRSFSLWAVFIAIVCQVGSYGGIGYVTRSLVRLFSTRVSLLRCMLIALASYSLSLVWGGQVAYTSLTYRWLRNQGVDNEAALLTGLIPALLNLFTITLLSVFAIVFLLANGELSAVLAGVFGLALVLIVMSLSAIWWGVRHPQQIGHLADLVNRGWARFRRRAYHQASTEIMLERVKVAWTLLLRGGWKGPFVGDVINVGFDILTVFFLFVAAHHALSPVVLLAGYGLPALVGKLSIVPGGVGLVEGSMAAVYHLLGVPSSVAVAVVFAYRAVEFWLPVASGFPIAVYLSRPGRVLATRPTMPPS
jgi:uncharacterized protein (TIRG00374 family)